MPKVEFVTESGQDSDNVAANPARLLNLYATPVALGGRSGYALKPVLGQRQTDDIGTSPIRAMGRGNNANWCAGNGSLYEIAADGTTTSRAVIVDDEETTIAGNQNIVTIVSGGNYYAWDGTTLSQPTEKTFTTVRGHCYVAGYTVIHEDGGRRFQWSSQGDATTLDALDFATADQVDDNIVRCVEFRGLLLVMCETSTEIWANQPGTTDTAQRFAFTDLTNTGLKDFKLLVRFDDALFFVGNDNRAYLYGQGRVSNAAVETDLKSATPTHCFYFEDEGNKFCVIRFSDRPAWMLNLTTGLWSERSENGGHQRWRATSSLRNGTEWLVGNTVGELLELARTNGDLEAPLFRRAIARTVYLGDKKVSIPMLEILGRVGMSDLTDDVEFVLSLGDGNALSLGGDEVLRIGSLRGDGREASISLYESGDGGITWRGPKPRSMGRLGQYDKRMVWRSRGQFQQYTVRLDIDEPSDLTLYSDGILKVS